MEIFEQARDATLTILDRKANARWDEHTEYGLNMLSEPVQLAINSALQEKDAEIGRLNSNLNLKEIVRHSLEHARDTLRSELQAYEGKIIELSIKGTDATRFDSVGEMQAALLHKEVVTLRSTVEDLGKYVQHNQTCDIYYSRSCTCGLSKLLEGIKR